MYNGNKFGINVLKQAEELEFLNGEMYRVYNEKSQFVGIYRYDSGLFVLEKMFYDPEKNVES